MSDRRTDLNSSGAAILGTHGYSGIGPLTSPQFYTGCKSFSVGIWQWVKGAGWDARMRPDAVKHGRVKVRISGSTSSPEYVYMEARHICRMLDAGTYKGPKHVRVKP